MKKLIYFGDPMCSWCYGFAPTMSLIKENFQEHLEITVVLGGLYTGGTTVQDTSRISFLQQTWQKISDLTGQEFNFAILQRQGWLYDTELACRAVVAARKIKSELTLDFFHEIQKNFYIHDMDSQSEETFRKAAESLAIDGETFMNTIRSQECISETLGDFQLSKTIGVSGFPTLLLQDGKELNVLTNGFQKYENLEDRIKAWL